MQEEIEVTCRYKEKEGGEHGIETLQYTETETISKSRAFPVFSKCFKSYYSIPALHDCNQNLKTQVYSGTSTLQV